MRKKQLWVFPALLIVVALGLVVADSLRIRNTSRQLYALPKDRSAQSLLAFMRKMDGAVEFSQVLMPASNVTDVSSAVLEASRCMQEPNSLTREEQREADFYRVKYLGAALLNGHKAVEQTDLTSLVSESKLYLLSAESYSAPENQIVQGTLVVLESAGEYEPLSEFLSWLRSQDRLNARLNRDLLDRINAISKQLDLVRSPFALQSQTLQSEKFDSSSLRGRVVLIEFWGPRCKPCIADLPALKRIYNTYHDRGFEVVGVCLNAEPERIRRFATEHDLPWIQLCHRPSASSECNEELSDLFGVQAVPTTILLDSCGRVVRLGVRPLAGNVDDDLEALLMQYLPQ